MAFFQREKTSMRNKSSQYAFDYDQHYQNMLNGLTGDFTFGRNSGFAESPYEIFRQNVAKYCEQLTYSFDQDELVSSEEKALRGLRRVDRGYDARLAEGDASCWQAEQRWVHAEQEVGHPEERWGHGEQVIGHPEQKWGHAEQEVGHPEQRWGHAEQVTGHPEQRWGHAEQETGHPEQVIGHSEQRWGCADQVVGHPEQAIDHAEPRDISDFQEPNILDDSYLQSSGNADCDCSGICDHCRARPSKSTTNILSVMSVSFEPLGDPQKKPSLLKKIAHLMNSEFSSRNTVKISRKLPLKEKSEPTKRNTCECKKHVGKHSNCCQCQEPYHRTNCECVQHRSSHQFCCKCDPHLLQEYDQHLKKKRLLRLVGDEELSPVNSVNYQDREIAKFPWSSPRGITTVTACCDKKPSMKDIGGSNPIPTVQSRPPPGDRHCHDRDDAGETDGGHPCEACCKKLDKIYGTALREVHTMLMDVSRTLLPPTHCCSLEARIQNVSRLRPPSHQMEAVSSQILETIESVAEPDWADVSGTSEIGVQVNPKDITAEASKKKMKKLKQMKEKCIIS